MTRKRKQIFILSLVLLSGLLWPQTAVRHEKLKIMTSVFPLWEFARAVVGERAEVNLLLPPGAGVHTWQPRVGDIARLSQSHLFIYVGAGLEPWVSDILRSIPRAKIKPIAAGDFLPLIREKNEDEHGVDPHIWLDFSLDEMIIKRISETLSALDPPGTSLYAKNASEYCERLRTLDALYATALAHCRHKTILIGGHAAFGYLARRYGLDQISLYGLSPDAEPTPSRLSSAIEWAKANNIKAVFMEANTSAKLAKVLAKEIQADLLTLNPGANLNKKQLATGLTFFDIMEENLYNLKKGLGCE